MYTYMHTLSPHAAYIMNMLTHASAHTHIGGGGEGEEEERHTGCREQKTYSTRQVAGRGQLLSFLLGKLRSGLAGAEP